MATLAELENAIDAMLNHPLGVRRHQLVRRVEEKAYEAYVFGLCLRAVRELRVTPVLRGITGPPNPFIFRGAPGQIHSQSRNFGYAEFSLNGQNFEIHACVEFKGTSGMTHELDVCILRGEDADRCRTWPDDPPSASLIAGWECKFYAGNLQKGLGRAFVGLIDDMGGNVRLNGFCSNSVHPQLLDYFQPRRRPHPHFQLTPLEPYDALKKILNTIRSGLEDLPALREHPRIRVSWSLGAGNWARIPWISLADERETTSTQRGTYCVFLFPEDMSGAYLTLNQGVTETIDKHGRLEGRKVLRQKAQAMRSIVGDQIGSRFSIDDEIDLRTDGSLGQDYEASTVAYRLYSKGEFPPDSELNEDLAILLSAYANVLTPPPPVRPGPRRQPTYTIDDFVRESRLSSERIKRWQASLLRKKQIILQGPPGTGKTFVAERLAQLLVSETAGFWNMVQFHPSYAYEDFMQGIRPSVEGGALSYSIEPGRFLQFCKHAKDTNGPAVLIIDEINRGNLSRIFGELMYLLEYRDKEVPLASGGSAFRIPKNVYLIGTMNTADRSIALVDHALRRRFSFIYLEPDYDVLKSHLSEHGLPVDSLIKTLKALNTAIDDRHYSVGISFFLTDGKQLRSTLEEIWRGEIEPYLEEYFYDQPDKAKAFRWETLVAGEMADWA
jgi:MrcB-like, N-terminal domain/AAA domain (dynein-related subfamily)